MAYTSGACALHCLLCLAGAYLLLSSTSSALAKSGLSMCSLLFCAPPSPAGCTPCKSSRPLDTQCQVAVQHGINPARSTRLFVQGARCAA